MFLLFPCLVLSLQQFINYSSGLPTLPLISVVGLLMSLCSGKLWLPIFAYLSLLFGRQWFALYSYLTCGSKKCSWFFNLDFSASYLLLGHTRNFKYLNLELEIRSLCLIFKEAVKLFSKMTTPFYISTSSVCGFHFLHILTNICYYFLSLNFFLNWVYLFLRERESTSEGRGRERERQRILSRVLSVEPDGGLNPTMLRSWPGLKSKVKCSTGWATQVPLFYFL